MNKNIIWILLIFLVPLCTYFGLTRTSSISHQAVAIASGDEIIKFASPMCFECNELEKVIDEVFPKYENKITLRKIDVTKNDKNVRKLITEYDVTLVPTTVFKNQDGKITKKIVGTMKPEVLEEYMAELINE